MRKREASFQTTFNQWCRDTKRPTAAYELKQTEMGNIPFDAVEEHQINGLLAAKEGILCYKIPDDSIQYKPFDSFCLNKVPAFVVIKYEKHFYGITIENFLIEKNGSQRKSLLESRAKEISSFSG